MSLLTIALIGVACIGWGATLVLYTTHLVMGTAARQASRQIEAQAADLDDTQALLAQARGDRADLQAQLRQVDEALNDGCRRILGAADQPPKEGA